MALETPPSLSEMPPAAGLKLVTLVRLCGQAGLLYSMDQGLEDQATFVWRSDRRGFLPGTSPLLLACKVAELYHLRQAVWLLEAMPEQTFEIVWLEVSCDDTLSVVLRPHATP